MQSAGTRLDPVTAAAGSAHARGRKGRSAGGAPLRGWATKAFAKIRLGSLTYGLRWTEGRAAGGGEWGSGKVATRSRCCTVWPPNTRLEVTKMTHSLKVGVGFDRNSLQRMLDIGGNDKEFNSEKKQLIPS